MAQLCRGVAGGDAAALLSAAQAYRQAGRALYEGYAYETAAAVLAGQGGLAQARAALESALQRYDELDAGFDASRAEARLRQAGIRRRAARRRPGTGWASLTDTERAIAFRVAQGRANADIAAELFLARRTVQSHVSRILAKLGLSSRIDLATFSGDRAGSPVHEE